MRESTFEDGVEVVVLLCAVVGHAVVLVVVRSYLLRARAGAHLHPAARRHLGELLLALDVVELGAEHGHGELLVLELRALLRAEDANAGGLVCQVHRRLHLVHVLAPGAPGAGGGELDVLGVYLHVHVVHLGHHRHRGGGGVDAPLRLRRRHALHAVHARLELELAVDGVTRDLDGGLLVAARVGLGGAHQRRAPPLRLRVLGVQPHQVPGPDGGLVAAGARADLEHDVALVQRVLGKECPHDLLLQLRDALLQGGDLLERHGLHVRVAPGNLPCELLGGSEVTLGCVVGGVRLHQWLLPRALHRQPLELCGVACHLRLGQPRLHLTEAVEGVVQLLNHELLLQQSGRARQARRAHRAAPASSRKV
mmetsp:Transcript_10708/g.39313  ORF Transcript_10708/g.39313 Transcript_10708/m.39313 type:complete len:366 (+) Transcript_10708:720-1817(+)